MSFLSHWLILRCLNELFHAVKIGWNVEVTWSSNQPLPAQDRFLFSEIFWLQFCTVGGGEDVSSIFILSMLESLKVYFAKQVRVIKTKNLITSISHSLKKSNYAWYHNVSVKFNLWIMSMNVRIFKYLVRLPLFSMAAFTAAGVDTTSWDGTI